MRGKFKNQAEYSDFRAWKYEGSCLSQRMAASAGGRKFEIPEHWHFYKELDRDWPYEMPEVY
jgi:hypothetical protein